MPEGGHACAKQVQRMNLPRGRRAHAGLVVIHADLAQPRLAGVLEPALVGRGRRAEFIIVFVRMRLPPVSASEMIRPELVGV